MSTSGTSPDARAVLVFHPEGNPDNNPTLHAWLVGVTSMGFEVTVIAQVREHQAHNGSYRLRTYGRWYSKLIRTLVDQTGSAWLARLVTRIRFYTLLARKASHLVGIDRYGLIQAWSFLSGPSQRLGFLSFEIDFAEEIGRTAKQAERRASRDVSWWVSQDSLRAQMLCRENGLDMAKGVTTAVASSGRAASSAARLRDDLGIPKNVKVVMSMGSLAAWTMLPEILNSVELWPADWVLLVHERYAKTEESLASLTPNRVLAPGRIYLSAHRAASPDDLAYVLSGVDLGLAFYAEQPGHPLLGKNLRYMGRSSGKISTFVRHGIPVVSNLGAPVSQDLDEFAAGLTCASPDLLPEVLTRMNPQDYRDGAYAYFDQVLDFAQTKETLLRLLESDDSPAG